MSIEERRQKIRRLEELRKSFVMTYVTGDRPNVTAIISEDVVRFFYEQLLQLDSRKDKPKKIDLFLYSRGGDTGVPWRLVPTIREFSDSFDCLVPFKAHSAATMIALGADSIVMGRKGELGPIDPNITTPFNPADPSDSTKTRKFPISVEDVVAYLGLLEEKVKLKGRTREMTEAFGHLAREVNPLALGAVNRQHSMIRMLGTKLLKQRSEKDTDAQIKGIVDQLTEKLYFHGHAINREEASGIGLHVEEATGDVEKAMWDLFLAYEADMKLQEPFYPYSFFDNNPSDSHIENGLLITAIESSAISMSQHADAEITRRRNVPPNLQLNLNLQMPPLPPQQQQQLQGQYQQVLQQLMPQIQQQVQDAVRQQAPVVGFELVFKNQRWTKDPA